MKTKRPTTNIVKCKRATPKLNDEKTKKRKKKAGHLSFLIHYITLSIFIVDYIWSSYFYNKNKHKLNIYPVCYEKLLQHPVLEIKKICSFCEISFNENMLFAMGKPSSHTGKIAFGVDKKRLFAWQTKLSKFDLYLITFLTKKSMKMLGYKFQGFDSKC